MTGLWAESGTLATLECSHCQVDTQGIWLGPAGRPLAGWLSVAAGRPRSDLGVLILPSVGYEYWTAHRTLRVLAERLAGVGHTALRIDYDGVGDSAGDQSDPERWESWRTAVGVGTQALRAAGATRIALVGLRLGATIALLEAADSGADAVVAALPVVSGRRYAGELALMSEKVPAPAPKNVAAGTVVYGGTVMSPETIDALRAIDLISIQSPTSLPVLLIDRQDGSRSQSLATRLEQLGCALTYEMVGDMGVALDRPTEEAEASEDLAALVSAWIGPAEAPAVPPAPRDDSPSATIAWQGGLVREQFVRIGETGLVGVRTQAEDEPAASVVLLNSGSEPHVGPGRAWVELSRMLALRGFRAFRTDFRGWGESPDDGFAPGRPYDAHVADDLAEIVEALRAEGGPPVVLAGICAGAWMALQAATRVPVDAVIAINPQLYWQPGDPVEALMADTRSRRMAEIQYFKECGHELELERPHPAAEVLERLQSRSTPTLILSSPGDDGLEFLESRLPRAWASATGSGIIRHDVVTIDHALHRFWERGELLGPVVDFLTSMRHHATASRGTEIATR